MQKFKLKIKALTPICHGDTATDISGSNTRIFMRQGMVINGIPMKVPCLSENALRSVIFRVPLATHLLQALELEYGKLPKSVSNLMFSGGNLKKGAKEPGNAVIIAREVFSAYPSLELLSGATDNFVLPESSLRLAVFPVTQEYLPQLKVVAPEETDEASKVSIFDLIFDETRTRGTGNESEGNQMLYSYETIAAGCSFVVMIQLTPNASPLCQSALGAALQQWNGLFGGQGRQGRGFMAVESHNLPDAGLYLDYVSNNKEELAKGLVSGTLCSNIVLCS